MTSNKNKLIYFDVTQLAHWQGMLTGIPRVMYELSKQFYDDNGNNVVFVSWVKELGDFCEIDYEKTILERGNGIVYISPTSSGIPTTTSSQLFVVKKYARKAAKKGFNVAAKTFKSQKIDRLKEKLQEKVAYSYKKAGLDSEDILFIPWGEWWDETFISRLETLHRENGVKLVQILHDMSPIVVPQFSNSGNATETYPVYCKRIYPICDLILSVSKNSKKDAEEWLTAQNLSVPDIQVFRLGDNITVQKTKKTDNVTDRLKTVKDKKYILSVGTIELKKNHRLIYDTYKLAKQNGITLPMFIMAGRLGWMSESTVELIQNDPDVKDLIKLVIEPSDQELTALYNGALFTVLPSYYEGWGIPIAESLAYGVPCLSSNTSSMVEIAPGITRHFSPYSAQECLDEMVYALDEKNFKELQKKTSSYTSHSWKESYHSIKKILVGGK